ncbi:MAG: hypothetical protein Q7U82_15125, partial [Gammaproteobacteria bacterium]|nr:hypothetical protein [Gammaproteobacteria bacterium]
MSKATFCMLIALAIADSALAQGPATASSPPESDSPIKYAIYSSAWGEKSNAGLRLVAQNQSEHAIRLDSILFRDENNAAVTTNLAIDLTVAAQAWAETEMSYVDLLSGSKCISDTMAENWKLVEISNYTLNPSVRGLIIEDTDSFRIYQCVRNVTL